MIATYGHGTENTQLQQHRLQLFVIDKLALERMV